MNTWSVLYVYVQRSKLRRLWAFGARPQTQSISINFSGENCSSFFASTTPGTILLPYTGVTISTTTLLLCFDGFIVHRCVHRVFLLSAFLSARASRAVTPVTLSKHSKTLSRSKKRVTRHSRLNSSHKRLIVRCFDRDHPFIPSSSLLLLSSSCFHTLTLYLTDLIT